MAKLTNLTVMTNPNVSIFHTEPIPDGHSWSVVSLLGTMLIEAETLFGDRDKSFTILGVELTTEDHPHTWYPGNCKHIIIELTENCQNDINRAIFQLAHEVIHCLSPSNSGSNVLEEGLATWFSNKMCKQFSSSYFTNNPQYLRACKLVEKLMQYDINIIKKVRVISPCISNFQKSDLLAICPNIDDELIDDLLSPFEK